MKIDSINYIFNTSWNFKVNPNTDFRFAQPSNIETLLNGYKETNDNIIQYFFSLKLDELILEKIIKMIISYSLTYPYDENLTSNENSDNILNELKIDKPEVYLPLSSLNIDSNLITKFFKSIILYTLEQKVESNSIDLIYENLGGYITSTPCASTLSSGEIDVYARSASLSLLLKHYSDEAWFPFQYIGGIMNSSPSSVSISPNLKIVFFTGTDYNIFYTVFDGANYSNFRKLNFTASSSPSAINAVESRIDLFVRGDDLALYHSYLKNNVWSEFKKIGGFLSSSPSVTSSNYGIIDIFARGNDNLIYYMTYNVLSDTYSDFTSIGGAIFTGLTSTSRTKNNIDIFCRSSNNFLVNTHFDGKTWSEYKLLNKKLYNSPAATSINGDLNIFAMDENSALIRYYTGIL